MYITTSNFVPGHEIEMLGLVRGNIVAVGHAGKNIMAEFKSIAGGEIKTWTDLTNNTRKTAEQRMIAAAEAMGADAVVAVRFASETVAPSTSEVLAYGTAVKFFS